MNTKWKFWKEKISHRKEVKEESKSGVPTAYIGTHVEIEGALKLSPSDSKAQNLKILENWLDDNIYHINY